MKPPFTVEEVGTETLATLTRVFQAAARALEQRGAPLWPPGSLEPEVLLNDHPQSKLYLGFLGGEAVAGVILLEEDPRFWPDVQTGESLFIHKLTVTPSAQGTGIGILMLNFALARARAQDKRYVRLDCGAKRSKLRAFYERYSFTCVGEGDVGVFPTALYELDVRA